VGTSKLGVAPVTPVHPALFSEPLLPRAAGGGAGAVAALVVLGAELPPAAAIPVADREPQPAASPYEAAPEEQLAPEEPPPCAVDAGAPITEASVALPAEPLHAETAPPADPDPQPVAAANESAPDITLPCEAAAAPASEAPPPSLPVPPQPTLAELIPQVLPSPPKLPALSPSVAPVLRPLQLEPVRPRAPVAQAVDFIAPPPEPLPPPQAPLVAALPIDAVTAPLPSPAAPLPLPSRAWPSIEWRHVRRGLRVALMLLVAVGGLLLALLLLYRWVDPPTSTLMLGQRLAGTPISQRWVPLERVSPNLSAAVISSEDGHFCRHRGVDWGELKEAIESAGDGMARGGSTISMQVVKNLFLWPSRSYLRKALEIPLAYAMEALWPKRRILEIYLNIAEWGPGIFGAEAAARYHFRKSALLLTTREAALLAVSLPNPFERQAGRPGPGTVRLADNLLLRMRATPANMGCVRASANSG